MIHIQKVLFHPIRLPFAFDFSHALKKGRTAANVVVEIVAESDALHGYGEGAPRSYVTGENLSSAAEHFQRFVQEPSFPWDLADVSEIQTWVNALPASRFGNASLCALETALLDVLGRFRAVSVIDFFPSPYRTDHIVYGGALPLTDANRIRAGCRLLVQLGIRRLKMKLGPELDQNRQMLHAVKAELGEDYDLKVDVNCAWTLSTALKHIPLLQQYRVRVVEQPLAPGDPGESELAAAMEKTGMLLMADESVCTLEDLNRATERKSFGMINIRLSKCGGFVRSLQMVSFVRQNAIPFQVACHLGESGILSAAGRALGLLCGDALYWDGSYDAFLLKENLTREPVSFGPGGAAGPLPGPGFGVEVRPEQLSRLHEGEGALVIRRP